MSGDDELKASRFVRGDLRREGDDQLELFLSYGIHPRMGDERIRPRAYHADIFVLLPHALGLSPSQYPREGFLSDLTSFVRLREPKFGFKEMEQYESMSEHAPIRRIDEFLRLRAEEESLEPYVEECKLFAVSFKRYGMKKLGSYLTRDDPFQPIPSEELQSLFTYVFRMQRVLRQFRLLRQRVDLLDPIRHEAFIRSYHDTDESCSYVFQDGLLLLTQLSSQGEWTKKHQRLKALVRFEGYYRRKHSFYPLGEGAKPDPFGDYLQRRRQLKEWAASGLFLRLKRRPFLQFQRQVGPMLAAGLAGAWAFFIGMYLTLPRLLKEPVVQGSDVMIVMTLLTLSYVLKDRIKELGRSAFKSGIFRRIPDASNRLVLTQRYRGASLIYLGVVMEYVQHGSFARFLEGLPLAQKNQFHKKFLIDIEPPAVLHYQKTIAFRRKGLQQLRPHVRRVDDILKIDTSSWINNLSPEKDQALVMDDQGEVAKLACLRQSQAYVFVKISADLPKGIKFPPWMHGYEVGLNRQGITKLRRLKEI